MRKYSAIFALILTLWGVFSPLGISIVTTNVNRANTEQKSVAIKIETQKAFAQQTTTAGTATAVDLDSAVTNAQSLNDINKSKDGITGQDALECGILDVFCGIFRLIVNFTIFIPNLITAISGMLMDLALSIAINPLVYGINSNAVETGLRAAWGIIRDFANIGFIFALFVIAFSLILNKDLLNFEPKKAIVKVVMMALLINFSFLMCRLIIQTADIFSHLLFSKITVQNTGGDTLSFGNITATSIASVAGAKSPSLAIVSKVNPQKLFVDSGIVQKDNSFSGYGAATGAAVGLLYSSGYDYLSVAKVAAGGAIGGFLFGTFKGPAFYVAYGTMAIVSFFIYLILIFVFLSSAFLFLGRIFGLWVGIILSPIAFVSYTIPALEKKEGIGFESWLSNFVGLAFATPIFMFFLYLTTVVLDIGSIIPDDIKNGSGLVVGILTSLLPVFGAAFMLLKGKKIATDMSGEIGKFVGKYAGMVGSLALGAATGGTAMLGRQTFGRAGAAIANSSALRNAEAKGSGMAGFMRSAGSKTSALSFDVRNSKMAMDGFGKFTDSAGSKIELGSQYQQDIKDGGGYKKEGSIENKYYDYKKEIEEKKKKEAEEKAKGLLLGEDSEETQKLRLAEKKLRDKEEDMTEEAKYAVDEAGTKETKAKERAEATPEFEALIKAKEGQESHEKETKAEKTLLEKDIASKEKEFTDSIADLTDQIKESKKGLIDTDVELKATNLSLATATGDKKKELESKKQELESKKQVLSNQVTTLENTKQTKKSDFENNNPDLATKRTRLTTINTERTAKQKSVTDAKAAYENTEEFNKLKTAKDEKKQKEADLNQIKKDVKNTDEFKAVDAIKKKIETTNKAVLETYAKTLDNATKVNSSAFIDRKYTGPNQWAHASEETAHKMAGYVGVISGGNIMGRSVLQGGKRSSSAVRNIARTSSGPGKPPGSTK